MKILLVDDEPAVLRMMSLALEGSGYAVVQVSNAEDAMRLCEQLKDDLALLITDVTLPGMNGRELAKWVSRMPRHVPVILMSGDVEGSPPVQKPHKDGFLDDCHFIAKPFQPRQLLDVVSRALSESKSV